MTKQIALEQIEKFMDSELTKRKAGRADYIGRNSNSYKIAVEAINNPGKKVRTARCYSRSQQSWEHGVLRILDGAGIHRTRGNDAPRGGIHGDYVIVNLED